ncbi:MAG: hypothetical protein V4495_17000, partial [Pseudomonadota bacterium]
YGAINLAGAQLSNIENITANSAVVITASQYAALIAARAAMGLTGPVITFIGNTAHQLTIVDDIAGAYQIDLSKIAVLDGSLIFDTTSSAANNATNDNTSAGAIQLFGNATANTGTVGNSPFNGGIGTITPPNNSANEIVTVNNVVSTTVMDTLNLAANTTTAGRIVITGNKDITIASSSMVVNQGSMVESVNYQGGIAQAGGRLASLDASAFTGNLTINLGNGIFSTVKANSANVPQDVSIIGGKGHDTFILADTIEAGDSLTGGDGTDTLIVVNGGNLTAVSSILTKVEALQVLLNNAASVVDFTKLPDVTGVLVRNVSNTNVAAPANSAPVAGTDVFTLNNLNVAQAAAITIRHSDTGSNGIAQSTINANLAVATGTSDTVAVTIAEGLNVDPRFNFVLNTNAVENIILVDADTESNTVALANVAAHTGTITIGTAAGAGSATTFLNLDTTVAGNGGLYRIDTTGGAAANIAGIQDLSATAGQIKLVAASVDASLEQANVIVRVSSSSAGNGAQNIRMGSGNDTVIFDNIQDTRAGLTSADTVAGGNGTGDTLVIDGDLAGANLGDTIALVASEWTNVSGFETIRLVGTSSNAGVTGAGNYRLTLTDALITANNNAGVLAIVNDDDTANDTSNAGDTVGTGVESAATIDARSLSSLSRFSYNGEEGVSRTADRFIFTDTNFNGTHAINGGAVDNNVANNSQKNDDVIELRNASNASTGDFNGISNVGNIELTNDTAVTQVSQIQLNDTIVDALVDSYQASNNTSHIERLTIRAIDSAVLTAATIGLSLSASGLTDKSALDVTLGRGTNFIATGAAADRVVLLGNYVAGTYNATENGVGLNAQSTATDLARIVTDTINLGSGNDTLVTYGAINLAGAALAGVENITANSAVVINASQYLALIAARAVLSLSGPTLTFAGAGPHQLTIVDDIAGVNNIDLSYISVTGGSLVYDLTSASNASGGNVNNMTTSNTVSIAGGIAASAGAVGVTPSNAGSPAPVALTAAGSFNGSAGVTDNFTGLLATLNGTAINGNSGDIDTITISDSAMVQIGNGAAGATITNIKILNLANATNSITFANATTGIATINGGTGNDTVNLANTGSSLLTGNINLGAGNNTLILEAAKTYSGTYSASTGTDTLVLSAADNIAAASISGFENMTLSSAGTYTMTAAQYNAFTGTVTAGNTETIALTTSGTVVANALVEGFMLANGSNTFTAGSNTASVVGGTGADTFNYTAAQIAIATTLDGGAGADVLNIAAIGAHLNIGALVTGIETINVTGSAATGYIFTNENGAGVVLNYAKGMAWDEIVLGTGGQTLNLSGAATTAISVTGGAGVDTINLSTTATGAETVNAGSVMANIDTVANFKVAGADVFKTGTNATTLTALSIATADVSTLAAVITSAATVAGATLAANTQAYIVTVAAGTAAGTYAFQNIGDTVGAVDATDFIVKIIAAGSIVVGDFVA